MQITLRDSLAYVEIGVVYEGRRIVISDVLLDTGSANTVLSIDDLSRIGIYPQADDLLYLVRGVGGAETVFSRRVDTLQVGSQVVENMEIEVGGLDYGFAIRGILGMDFLLNSGAIIDLGHLTVAFPE